MFSETAYSSQTKLIGLNLPIGEHGIGYSNLTPDPKGARGAPEVKIQVSPNQKNLLTKVVRHDKGMIKISSAPPEELGNPRSGFPSNSIIVKTLKCMFMGVIINLHQEGREKKKRSARDICCCYEGGSQIT